MANKFRQEFNSGEKRLIERYLVAEFDERKDSVQEASMEYLTDQQDIESEKTVSKVEELDMMKDLSFSQPKKGKKTSKQPDITTACDLTLEDMLEMTDMKNGEYLSKQINGKYIFDEQNRCWRCYKDGIWEKVADDSVYGYVEKCLEKRAKKKMKKAGEINSKLLQHYMQSLNYMKTRSALVSLRSKKEVRIKEMDVERDILVTKTGVWDHKNDIWMKHSPELYQTRMINAVHKELAFKDSKFEKFLKRITLKDVEYQEYLQCCFAAALIGIPAQQVYVCYGDGGNGKSTLLEAIACTVGEYAYHIPSREFNHSGGAGDASPFWAETIKKRILISRELKFQNKVDESFLKELASGVPLNFRKLYGEPFQFTPQFTIFIDTNYTLNINGNDRGILRRLVVLPFLYELDKEEYNIFMMDELTSKKERAAIWWWLYEGIKKVITNTAVLYKYPPIVEEYTRKYVGNLITKPETVRRFASECCEKCFGEKIQASVLFDIYSKYCDMKHWTKAGTRKFGEEMPNYFQRTSFSDANYYINISLKKDFLNTLEQNVARDDVCE